MNRIPARIREKIKISADGCWYWMGAIGGSGTGHCWWDGKLQGIGRVIHELFIGPVKEDHEISTSCHRAVCCSPAHLRMLGPNEMRRDSVHSRKTHCPAGHEYNEENTYYGKSGRQCNRCREIRDKRGCNRGAGNANARKTHCKNGHEFTDENTYICPKNRRVCRECRKTRAARDRQKTREFRAEA